MAVWIGSSFAGMPPVLHITIAIVAAAAGRRRLGRDRRAPEGDARGQRGDLDDHAQLDRDLGRRLPVRPRRPAAGPAPEVGAGLEHRRRARPSSRCSGATRRCRGCTSGCSSRSRAWSCSGCILSRTRLGYRGPRGRPEPGCRELRPGSTSRRNYFTAMAICGTFAGVAAAMDILGWKFKLFTNDIQASQVGFLGIAVALLGRNTAVGVVFAALAVRRASDRDLRPLPRPERVRPEPGVEPHADDPGPDRAAGLDRSDRAERPEIRARDPRALRGAGPSPRRRTA